MRINTLLQFLLCCILLVFTSCGTLLQKPAQTAPARLGEETQTSLSLRDLPDPAQKVVAAVYQFRDQTGQYKANGGFSTAVTQGGTNILLKALKDSGWFAVIERENVNNLLQERKIIRSTQQQLGINSQVSPLLYASVILEGGIVSYDTNVMTGGAGVRYFGAGGSEQYRQDRVTVYLRVVSVRTGEVLKVIYTSKKILSQAVDGGLFQYVSFRRLLEVETGFTFNEPAEIAVKEAIEKAVESLVVEGIIDGLWSPADEEDRVGDKVKSYLEERRSIPSIDLLGKEMNDRRGKFAVQIASGSTLYNGDFSGAEIRTGAEVGLRWIPKPAVSWGFNYGSSNMTAGSFYQAKINYAEVAAEYRLLPYDKFTPYLSGTFGYVAETGGLFNYTKVLPKSSLGGGLEYLFTSRVGFRFAVDYNFVHSDELDNLKQGRYNDTYWRGNIGVSVYFGNAPKGDKKFKF